MCFSIKLIVLENTISKIKIAAVERWTFFSKIHTDWNI